jgi:TonB family protein
VTRIFLAAVLTLCASAVKAQTDTPRSVSTAEAISHVIQRTNPKTPAIAAVAKVGGTVKVHIVVSTSGDVSSAAAVSGAPLLLQAATDAVKQWKFRPFLNGETPVPVATDIDVDFPGGSSESESIVRENYFRAEAECRSLSKSAQYEDAEQKCREAAEISLKLPTEAVLERSSAISLLANSLFLQHRFAESLPYYSRALELDEGYLKSNDADLATDYENVGRAYAASGSLSWADASYAVALSTFRAAIRNLPSMSDNYSRRLKRALSEYAQIKDAEGQAGAASALRQQAAEVSP